MEWFRIKINPVSNEKGDIICRSDDSFGYGFDYKVVTRFDRNALMMSDDEFNTYLISNGLVYWGKL
jgi:hypothetical protein